jgi:NADPH:quinone reductase-like Zn-dependent oxidoreductase
VITTVSAHNFEFVRALGADEVLDYKAAPFEDKVRSIDVVFDAVGGKLERKGRGKLVVRVAAQESGCSHGSGAVWQSARISATSTSNSRVVYQGIEVLGQQVLYHDDRLDLKAHYFFGCGWTPGSLLGGTMFFSRM